MTTDGSAPPTPVEGDRGGRDRALPAQPTRVAGHGVVLRTFGEHDVAFARALATDPYVPLTGSLPAYADEAEAAAWIRRQRSRRDEGVGYSFAVADPDTDRAVGQMGLWVDDLIGGRFTAGYAIAPGDRGRGLAARALRLLTDIAWTIPSAHRIALFVEPVNQASVLTAERAGFVREGLLRGHHLIGGRHRDMIIFARLRGDG